MGSIPRDSFSFVSFFSLTHPILPSPPLRYHLTPHPILSLPLLSGTSVPYPVQPSIEFAFACPLAIFCERATPPIDLQIAEPPPLCPHILWVEPQSRAAAAEAAATAAAAARRRQRRRRQRRHWANDLPVACPVLYRVSSTVARRASCVLCLGDSRWVAGSGKWGCYTASPVPIDGTRVHRSGWCLGIAAKLSRSPH